MRYPKETHSNYLYVYSLSIPLFVSPLSLMSVMLVFMLNPSKSVMSEARFWLLKIMWRIFTAPFYYVGFADFWIADQLNSLAVAFKDFHYFMCFYLTSHDVFTSKYSILSSTYLTILYQTKLLPV